MAAKGVLSVKRRGLESPSVSLLVHKFWFEALRTVVKLFPMMLNSLGVF